jgi:VanZ family protein
MRKFWSKHWKSIVWGVFILVLCGTPGNQINKVKFIDIPHLDKFVHFILYFVFTLLLISENNTQRSHRKVTVNAILIAAAISLSYGALIEILQKVLFINRSGDTWDMIANTFGFILATLLYRQINRVTEGYI